ncbi:unnamed protein product [Protopolystoma xenopodis]|uniref:Uncharacterized protein n=1 Tax=Protopolystoma xenopodis TaxID=117903 RepID=A0A3S5C8R5_9PLAT|nr:unnamed protein product [Protopolystoma xenopodis]
MCIETPAGVPDWTSSTDGQRVVATADFLVELNGRGPLPPLNPFISKSRPSAETTAVRPKPTAILPAFPVLPVTEPAVGMPCIESTELERSPLFETEERAVIGVDGASAGDIWAD